MTEQPSHHPSDIFFSHPSIDVAAGVLVAGLLWAFRMDHHDPLGLLNADQRQLAYGTVATATAALLGFGVTAMAIFVALVPGARLRRVLERRRATVRKTFSSTITSLFALTVVSLAGTFLDVARSTPVLRVVIYAVSTIALLRLARMLWLFSNLVAIGTRDRDEGTTDINETPMNLR
ncbi:MAG: hypothetical protein JWM72_1554 [Actinomycetia bacterium]|nr:hypothetical protein [Actinomycetes bacterium]